MFVVTGAISTWCKGTCQGKVDGGTDDCWLLLLFSV